MLRFPPNLNIELFQWHSAENDLTTPGIAIAAGTTSASLSTTSTTLSRICARSPAWRCSAAARKWDPTVRPLPATVGRTF